MEDSVCQKRRRSDSLRISRHDFRGENGGREERKNCGRNSFEECEEGGFKFKKKKNIKSKNVGEVFDFSEARSMFSNRAQGLRQQHSRTDRPARETEKRGEHFSSDAPPDYPTIVFDPKTLEDGNAVSNEVSIQRLFDKVISHEMDGLSRVYRGKHSYIVDQMAAVLSDFSAEVERSTLKAVQRSREEAARKNNMSGGGGSDVVVRSNPKNASLRRQQARLDTALKRLQEEERQWARLAAQSQATDVVVATAQSVAVAGAGGSGSGGEAEVGVVAEAGEEVGAVRLWKQVMDDSTQGQDEGEQAQAQAETHGVEMAAATGAAAATETATVTAEPTGAGAGASLRVLESVEGAYEEFTTQADSMLAVVRSVARAGLAAKAQQTQLYDAFQRVNFKGYGEVGDAKAIIRGITA